MKKFLPFKSFSSNKWIFSFYTSEMLISRRQLKQAVNMMDFKPNDHVFIPGVWSRYDRSILPENVSVEEADIRVGETEAFDYQDNTFDKAILSLFLASSLNPQAAFSEVLRVVRPGGEILIYDYFFKRSKKILEDCLLTQPVVLVDMTAKDSLGLKGFLLWNGE